MVLETLDMLEGLDMPEGLDMLGHLRMPVARHMLVNLEVLEAPHILADLETLEIPHILAVLEILEDLVDIDRGSVGCLDGLVVGSCHSIGLSIDPLARTQRQGRVPMPADLPSLVESPGGPVVHSYRHKGLIDVLAPH
jgi:hypothetical protein